VYAKQIALNCREFDCKKTKWKKHPYALNVLEFIDGSASKGTETSESSSTEVSVTESTITSTHEIDISQESNYFVLIFIISGLVYFMATYCVSLVS